MGVLWGGVHMRQIIKHAFYLAVGIVLALSSTRSAYAQQIVVTTKMGTLADGASYLIQFPTSPKWNGTLFLYSHGYVTPGSNNPAPGLIQRHPDRFDAALPMCGVLSA